MISSPVVQRIRPTLARASGIDVVLRRIGCTNDATEIATEWSELLGLTAQAKPQGFDLAYPEPLLDKLADCIVAACKRVGLKPYAQSARGIDVTYLLNDAWKEFRKTGHFCGLGAADSCKAEGCFQVVLRSL